MLRSKSFVKRTRKGNVVKVVKEHYLRDDIPCSSASCRNCTQGTPVLSSEPKSTSTFKRHYLVPDTNVFISQLDIMEHPPLKTLLFCKQ
ncbi:unnamed protein product [Rhizopus stolonifer]